MPVVLVLTKFDTVISQVLLESSSDAPQQLNRARDSANIMYEDSCRRAFDKEPGDIPSEIVSGICSSFPYFWRGQLTSLIIHSETKFRRSHGESGRDD